MEEWRRDSSTLNDEMMIAILQGLVCTVFNFKSCILSLQNDGQIPRISVVFQAKTSLWIFSNGGSSVSDSDLEFSSVVIAMNLSNSKKISSSRRVPLMEWRILLHSSRRASKSSFKISSLTLILKNVSSFDAKKGSFQDERNFAIFFYFENNEIRRKGEFTNFNEHIFSYPNKVLE
uniref:Uncharacterized protein n=1 Tax=Tanacetum cinerariifolium TaxID=118510 RepID=A0A699I9Q9_TANCI|nr:hypothetical protein [Tanacetum cinerariifolium]